MWKGSEPPYGSYRRGGRRAGAGADDGRRSGEDGADRREISGRAERRQAVRRLQFLRRPQRLQDGRRRDRADRLVRAVGQEGRLTALLAAAARRPPPWSPRLVCGAALGVRTYCFTRT